MAVSLGLWNGCFGRQTPALSEVSVSLPSKLSISGHEAAICTSVVRAVARRDTRTNALRARPEVWVDRAITVNPSNLRPRTPTVSAMPRAR